MNKTYKDTNSDQVPDRITAIVTVNSKAIALVTNTFAATKVLFALWLREGGGVTLIKFLNYVRASFFVRLKLP